LIISDLEIGSQYDIASTLLLILSIFSFTTVFQKYFDCIFLVRIEQYIYQRIKIVGNIFKICSVFYFFSDNNYNIVGYFLFIKCIDLIVQIITFFIVKKRYNISVSDFFSNFKFDNKIFNKTKSLAFNSIYLSLTFILYYELDIIAIGKYLSIEDVAIFSLAVFFLQFLRSISSIILSPFQSRFNHFIGLKNKKGMFVFYKKLIKVILPFFIFSGIIIAIYSKQIVISWAGNNYIESFQLLSLFGLFFILNAINVPSTNLLVSLEKLKDLYFINTLIVVFFWVGVYFTISHLGVISFAFFKFLSAIITSIYLIIIISKIIKLKPILYIYKYGKLFILPLISLFIVYEILHSYIVLEKGVLNFLMVSLIMITTFIFAFLVLLYTSKFYRNEYKMYLEKVLKIKN
jgi:O-antigen/teichoic acid export membrane protein